MDKERPEYEVTAYRAHGIAVARKRVRELQEVGAAIGSAEEAVHGYGGEKAIFWASELARIHDEVRDSMAGLGLLLSKWTGGKAEPVRVPDAPDYIDLVNINRW